MNIPKIDIQFNKKVKINFTGGELSSDSGLLLVKEFMDKMQYKRLLSQFMHVVDERKHCIHSNADLVLQSMLQTIAGYEADSAATFLVHDPVFSTILDNKTLASQPSLSRLYKRLASRDSLGSLWQFNQKMLDEKQRISPQTEMIVDLDSTYATTYGRQESTAYNAHYQTVGYHPLVAFDGLTGDCLKACLRAGNTYTSTDTVNFIFPTLLHYRSVFPEKLLLLRADSGFASPKIYEMCDELDIPFIIRLKSNKRISCIAEQNCARLRQDTTAFEHYIHETRYQATSWKHPRRIVIESMKHAGELHFTHTFIVTTSELPATSVLTLYKNRGTMENFIKEAKHGFHMDKMDSHDFAINYVKMTVSLLAYNLINAMKQLCFPPDEHNVSIATVRIKFIKVASKRIKTARYLIFQHATSFVYQKLYLDVLQRIQFL